MTLNRKIIIAAIVIAGSGIANSIIAGKPITPVIIGSYVFVFVLAIADMFGGGLSAISGGLAMVAVVYVLINEFPWQKLIDLATGKTTATTSTSTNTTNTTSTPTQRTVTTL